MTEFDTRAREWDNNPVHWERSQAIAEAILQRVPVHKGMSAMEYGAGTAILSFILADHFASITLMDQSAEMVKVMEEKVVAGGVAQLHPLHFDLEHTDYQENSFDCIFTQMVLHHVNDPGLILQKFSQLLKPGGYLAIADLYTEDGSFHGEGFTGHLGFDPDQLQSTLEEAGLKHLSTEKCFTVRKKISEEIREFPVFLMVARMPQ